MRIKIVLYFILSAKVIFCTTDSSIYHKCDSLEKIPDHNLAIKTISSLLQNQHLSESENCRLYTLLIQKFIAIQKFDTCIKICEKQIIIAKKSNKTYSQAQFYKLIGNTYYYIANPKLANTYYYKCIEISDKLGYYNLSENAYHNIGAIRVDSGLYDQKTESYLLKAIELNHKNKNGKKATDLGHYRILATLYERQNKLPKAEEIYKKIIADYKTINNIYQQATSMMFYSEVLMKQKKTKDAINMSAEAVRIAKPINQIDLISTALSIHAQNLKQAKMPDSAYQIMAELQYLIRDYYQKDLNKQIGEAEAKFKNAEVEHEKNVAILNEKRKLQLFLILCLAVLVSSVFIFKNYTNRKKLKQEKQLIQAVINAEEHERSRIAADLHDGIGQLLSAAKLNLHALENAKTESKQMILEKAILLVDESAKEVRSVSHNIMPNALIKSGIVSAIKKFIDQLQSDKLKIKIETSGLTKSINSNIEIVVYRIIQECINNVIKHSKANQLYITLSIEKEFLNIMIEDNGIGFDKNKTKIRDGIGLSNIETRIKFLKGVMEIDSRPNQGTAIGFHIPLIQKNDD
jgi:two-component system, NarL family, sensor kinase